MLLGVRSFGIPVMESPYVENVIRGKLGVEKIRKYKVLSTSDSLLIHTGYACQVRGIFKRLAYNPMFECVHFGFQMVGDTIYYHADSNLLSPRLDNSIKLLPASGRHQFGGDLLQKYIKSEQPDITFILADTFMYYPWIFDVDFTPSHSIFYFPSDGTPMPQECENILKKVEHPIAMSKFAQKQVADYYGVKADYIPHGVDAGFLSPASQETKSYLRREWGNRLSIDLTNKFVVLFLGRNQGRKMPGELIKVFAEFAKDKNDVVLILSCDPSDPAGMSPDFSMGQFIKFLKIEDKVRFSGVTYWSHLTDEEIKQIYQISDVYASTTSGEGFGIPTVEAMSCGVPPIITDCTTSEELVGNNDCGIRVPLYNHDDGYSLRGTITGSWNVERAMVDKGKFVTALNTVYTNRVLLGDMARNAREKVLKEYDWKVVYPLWESKFAQILGV